jgi:acyl dehydratase
LGIPPEAHSIIANLGADQLRFVAPTLIGDTVQIRACVSETKARVGKREGIVVMDWNIVNQNDVVLVVSSLSVLVARPVEAPHE